MALASTDPKVLMGQARCFSCLTPHEQLQAQTYLFAKIAGFDTSAAGVAALQAASACFSCLTRIQLMRLKAYLIATWLGLDTTLAGIQAQVKAAACQTCLTPRQQLQVQTYLLAVSAGLATDKAGAVSIEAAAKCFDCPTTKAQYEIQVYILAGLANVTSSTPSDLMAAAKCFESCLVPEIEDALLNSLITQSANRSTPPCVTPTAPVSSAGAKSIGNTSFRIVWSQPANTGSLITSYTIKWGTVSGVYPNSVTIPVIPRVYDLTGLTPGTQYFWVVVANSSAATDCFSANSNEGSATTTGSPPLTPLKTNLISYWKLDEGSNVTRVDSVGTNNLTDVNANCAAVAGKINNGIQPGATAPDSWVQHVDNSDFQVAVGQSISFSLWAQWHISAFHAFHPVLAKYISGDPFASYILFPTTDNHGPTGNLFFFARDLANANSPSVDSGVNLLDNPNVWFYFAFGYDDPNQQIWIQTNAGARVTAPCAGIHNFGQGFALGNMFNGGFVFTGQIDEVGMWKRVLTTAEVTTLYNGGAAYALANFYP